MKRPVILGAMLVLTSLFWVGLIARDRMAHRWIETASRDELQHYVRDHPDRAEALIRLSGMLRAEGDQVEAERLARRAVQVAPGDEASWVALSRADADDREATQGLQNFLKIKPDSAPVMAELARRYMASRDVAGARALADKAVQAQPELPDAWRVRGDVMGALRQEPEAEKDYKKALSLRDDPETRLALARTLIPLQRYPEILALCAPIITPERTAEVSSGQRARALLYSAGARLYDPLTTVELAAVQAQLKEVDSLSSWLPAEERFLPPYFLGESWLRLGRPALAIEPLKRGIAAGPMFAGGLYSLSRAYRLAGDPAKAKETAAKHARLSRILSEVEMYGSRLEQRPNDSDTMLQLAGALTEAGNTADAEQIYRRLIANGQAVQTAQHRLDTLTGR